MPLSINQTKYIRSLQLKKFRQKYENFVVEGDKMVKDILNDGTLNLEALFASEEWLLKNDESFDENEVEIFEISDRELKKISGLKTPNQVLVIAKQQSLEIDSKKVKTDYSLYLDNIQNPGNLGTIIRIADWFGIEHVFCSPDCADLYNPKVIQASMSAFLRAKVIKIDFEKLQQDFPEVPKIATVMKGESIYSNQLSAPGIIIIGNEGQGITSSILDMASLQVSIPSYSKNQGAESLNAAIATGIICAQLRNVKEAI